MVPSAAMVTGAAAAAASGAGAVAASCTGTAVAAASHTGEDAVTLYRPARRPGWWQEVPADEQEGGLDEMELMRTARIGLTTNVEMAEMREMHRSGDGNVEMREMHRSGDGNHCSTRNKLRHIMLRHIMAPTHGEQDRAEPRDEGAMHASDLAEEERQERLMK